MLSLLWWWMARSYSPFMQRPSMFWRFVCTVYRLRKWDAANDVTPVPSSPRGGFSLLVSYNSFASVTSVPHTLKLPSHSKSRIVPEENIRWSVIARCHCYRHRPTPHPKAPVSFAKVQHAGPISSTSGMHKVRSSTNDGPSRQCPRHPDPPPHV